MAFIGFIGLLPLSISLYLSVSLSLYLSVSLCISLYLSVSLCLSLYLSVSLCLSLSLSVSLCLSLSLSLSLSLFSFLGARGASPRASSPAPVFRPPPCLSLSLSLSLSLCYQSQGAWLEKTIWDLQAKIDVTTITAF